jgi:HAD superfamily hydrolase (TIGR01484 family)
MEKHIIIIDLDGTLMLDFSHYDEETIDYLKKLHNDGHIIVIATGRPLRSSFFVHQAIGLNTPIINYNGALVSNPFDDNFPKTDLRVEKDDLAKIFDFGYPKLYVIQRVAQFVHNQKL